jgi:outer membrane protein assembly factor BamE (lipoprotein component of BamABCDE complex)
MRQLILILAFSLVACTSTVPSFTPYKVDVQQGNVVTPKMMLQLKPGMNKSQVRFILGTPLLQDTFHRDRWDYFYELNKGGVVLERRRIILDFENEALKSVRGDIIPAGQPGAENAPIASVKEVTTAKSNKDLMLTEDDKKSEQDKKSWTERFKFWGDDDKSATATKPVQEPKPASETKPAPEPKQAKVETPAASPKPVVKEAVPEKSVAQSSKNVNEEDNKKSWLDRLKFWGDDEPATATSKSATSSNQANVDVPAPGVKTAAAAATAVVATKEVASAATKTANAVTPSTKANKVSPEALQIGLIRTQVNQWNSAWQGRRLNEYLNMYSANFQPEGLGRKAWLTEQQQKFGSAEYIEDIQLQNIEVEVHGSLATARFEQTSTTPSKVIKSAKELDFENEGGLWRIIRERVKTEFAPEELAKEPVNPSPDGVILYERSERPPEYTNPAPPTTTDKPGINNGQADTKAKQQNERNQLPEMNSKKDEPLPAEDEPGYFDKLLKRIGF